MSELVLEKKKPAETAPAAPPKKPAKPRPHRYGNQGVYVRLAKPLLGRVDAWMKIRSIESRPEAIREILEMGLGKVSQSLGRKP